MSWILDIQRLQIYLSTMRKQWSFPHSKPQLQVLPVLKTEIILWGTQIVLLMSEEHDSGAQKLSPCMFRKLNLGLNLYISFKVIYILKTL